MSFSYDNLKLDKGMYQEAGRTFTQVLESQDPSERYKGTSLEGLDAFQRQLKRFDIKVKGAGSDVVEKFFRTADSAVLFPEYIARTVRQGMEEGDLLPHITAATTRFDGMDYRSITAQAGGEEKELRYVDEGAQIPSTTIKVQSNLVKLRKRGRMLVASYEAAPPGRFSAGQERARASSALMSMRICSGEWKSIPWAPAGTNWCRPSGCLTPYGRLTTVTLRRFIRSARITGDWVLPSATG